MTKHVVWDPAGGIIIIANSLPNMVGADMLGNVRGASCWCIGGVLGLVRGVLHLKNLLVQELEGAASVGESRTASKRKKKPNPG